MPRKESLDEEEVIRTDNFIKFELICVTGENISSHKLRQIEMWSHFCILFEITSNLSAEFPFIAKLNFLIMLSKCFWFLSLLFVSLNIEYILILIYLPNCVSFSSSTHLLSSVICLVCFENVISSNVPPR